VDTRFQTSFIPKKPVDTGSVRPSGDVNLLLILSILSFIITAAAAGGVYLFKISLQKDIQQKDAEIKSAQQSFGLETIEYLKLRARHFSAASEVLSKHLAPSSLFKFLEEHTLRNVRFTSFELKIGDDGTVTLAMDGEARGFNAVAYQSEVFVGLNKDFINPSFSDFALDDLGNVEFRFETQVNKSIVSYEQTIGDSIVPTLEEGTIPN